jgi:hypothetical protein
MTVCALEDFSFTCSVRDGHETIESYVVPQPEGYHGDMPLPESRPDSACITCTTDGDKVVCAAAWVMHIGQHYKTYVRSFFVFEDTEEPGTLNSEEIFHERPRSSLHSVHSLCIHCSSKNRLCLVGSSPPAQSQASQEARNCSQNHITAIEVIGMRKFGFYDVAAPSGPPQCTLVHSLGNQMRDDINFLQSELRTVLDQRSKSVPQSGELHSAGGSGSVAKVFSQFLQQSQWWQVRCCFFSFAASACQIFFLHLHCSANEP